MIDPKIKELRGQSRRDFIRWAAVAAGAMGLERSRLLNVLNDTGGSALADTAACRATRRSIHLIDGNGGLSNWTQCFPTEVQATSTDANISFYAPGTAAAAAGYDMAKHPWWYGKNTPNQDGVWKWTGFVGGMNETHTGAPQSVVNLGGNSMLASIAAVQTADSTLLPVLTVGTITYGNAPGAPATAAVNASANLVDLFNSAASKALLSGAANGGLADQYYKAFLGLNSAAGRSTFAKQYGVGKVSMNLLAKNLASQLTPTTADQAIFGLNAQTPGTITQLANGFITTLKAMALGLTSMGCFTGFRDDPHGNFQNGNAGPDAKAASQKALLDGLYNFSKSLEDPSCAAKTLSQNLVMTISGDTYKNPNNRNGWGDGTPNNSNLLYVMSNGLLPPGWIGTINKQGMAQGFDPGTGALTAGYTNGAMLGQQAAAAALYATCADNRRVSDFIAGGAGAGITNVSLTGG